MTKAIRILKTLVGATALSGAIFTPAPHASEATIDQAAVKRLQESLDYLASLQQFSLLADTTIEVVLLDGQKIQFDNSVNTTVQRPDKMHARRLGDLMEQELFYDGETLTLLDSSAGYHASAAAPDNLEDALDFARETLDIVAPAGDFIHSNAFDILMENVESAIYIGSSYVEGSVCDHLAFSAPTNDTDFQVWVQQGEEPLPRRIVITSREITNAPQFTVHIREWDIHPKIGAESFRFQAPENSQEIEFILLTTADAE